MAEVVKIGAGGGGASGAAFRNECGIINQELAPPLC